MPTAAAKRLVEIPANVWTALRLKPGVSLQWEVRGTEAVMRPAANRAPSVDEVFGMLAQHVKHSGARNGRKAVTAAEMRTAAKQDAARRFVRSVKDAV